MRRFVPIASFLFSFLSLCPAAEPERDPLTCAVHVSITIGEQYLIDNIQATNGWTFALAPNQVPHGQYTVRLVTNRYSQKTVTVKENTYRHEKRTVEVPLLGGMA